MRDRRGSGRLFLHRLSPIGETTGGRCRSLVVGGSLRLQQTLTSCVAPLEEFTSLRQPVKGGNTTLITISRTKLHETTRRCIHPDPRGSVPGPFFLDLRIILPSSTTPPRQFRIKQDVRRAAREPLWEFSEYCVTVWYLIIQNFVGEEKPLDVRDVTNCNCYHILISNNRCVTDSFAIG